MIALFALPTHAAAPEPVTVFLVAPAGDALEPKTVLVPPDLLDRLAQAKERKLPLPSAVITRAEYKGWFEGKSTIEVEARFYVRSFVDSAELSLLLPGIKIQKALLGGAPGDIQTDGPDRYRFTFDKRGEDRLDLKFEVKVNGSGSEREARFGVPEVLQSDLRFTVPGDIEGFQAVNWRGIQQFLAQGRELRTDLGRTRQVYLRWREPGAASVAQVRVQHASVWDIRPSSASLLSVLDYRISQEGVTRFRVAVPKGLEVARLEVRPDAPAPTPLPAWIKDWHLAPESEPGSYRTLTVDLHSALSGSVRMVLELVPLRPLPSRPELRFAAALNVIESQGRVAYRLSGLETVGEPARNGLTDLSAAVFLDETWKRINEEKSPLAVTRAYRVLSERDDYLRLVLKPVPAAGTGTAELVWWLDPQRWNVRGDLRYSASKEPLSLAEWDISQSVKIHMVRGVNVERWMRTANRVQVWLKQPAKEVHLVFNGSMAGQANPPETIAVDLPGIRLSSVAIQDTTVRLVVPEGLTASVERLEQIGRPVNPQSPRETAIQLARPFDGLRVVVRTPQRDALFDMLSTVQIKESTLLIRSELDVSLRKERPHALTIHAGRSQGMTASLEVPPSCRIVDSMMHKEEQSWTVEVAPHTQDHLKMVLTLQRPILQMTELVLPDIAVTQDALAVPHFEHRIALVGSELQVLKAKQFLQLNRSDPTTQKLLPKPGSIWKQQDASGELSILAAPTTRQLWRPVRIALADLQAAPHADHWTYRGSFEVLHTGPLEIQVDVGDGSTIEGALLDGIEVNPGAAKRSMALALPAEGGYRILQMVWRRSTPAWETPIFSGVAGRLPIDRTLWTIELPQGMMATGMESVSAADLDLERAETLPGNCRRDQGVPDLGRRIVPCRGPGSGVDSHRRGTTRGETLGRGGTNGRWPFTVGTRQTVTRSCPGPTRGTSTCRSRQDRIDPRLGISTIALC